MCCVMSEVWCVVCGVCCSDVVKCGVWCVMSEVWCRVRKLHVAIGHFPNILLEWPTVNTRGRQSRPINRSVAVILLLSCLSS